MNKNVNWEWCRYKCNRQKKVYSFNVFVKKDVKRRGIRGHRKIFVLKGSRNLCYIYILILIIN